MKKSQGKHAAGIIVSSVPIEEVAPMIFDKSGEGQLVGLDWHDAELVGLPKMDVLGVTMLDKLHGAANLLAGKGVFE